MIIAIDASRAVHEKPTGTELYSARLIEYLAKIDNKNTYYLYTPTAPSGELAKLPKNFVWKVIPFKRLWTHIRLPLALLQDKPDLLFVPAHVLPFFNPIKKTVTTIHDIASEVFPGAYSGFQRWYFRVTTRRALKSVSAIITPSQSTKQDLIRIFQAPENKVTAVWLGFDRERFGKSVTVSAAVKKLQPYFVMLGRLEKRKNTAKAIEAFVDLRQEAIVQDDVEIRPKLVLIGKPGFGFEEIEAALAKVPAAVTHDIIQPGYLSDQEVVEYMAGAAAFLYPSLYEGFGIPILEAMSAGTPVITSDVSANPEVADDAAVYVDPQSTDEMVRVMKIFATDELSRTEIVKKGKERIKAFSWEKMAQETLAILEQVGKE
jgi:glycosyltransferase involved in cell wall biosynthesis